MLHYYVFTVAAFDASIEEVTTSSNGWRIRWKLPGGLPVIAI